jgi:hypothetical protein
MYANQSIVYKLPSFDSYNNSSDVEVVLINKITVASFNNFVFKIKASSAS